MTRNRVADGCDAYVPVEAGSAASEQTAQLATRAKQISVTLLVTAASNEEENFCGQTVEGEVGVGGHYSIHPQTVARRVILYY